MYSCSLDEVSREGEGGECFRGDLVLPSAQVNSKTRELAKLFEPPLDLMFQGSFDEVRTCVNNTKSMGALCVHCVSVLCCVRIVCALCVCAYIYASMLHFVLHVVLWSIFEIDTHLCTL